MTSLASYGGLGKQTSMYGTPAPITRTSSQPYLAKLVSASPEKYHGGPSRLNSPVEPPSPYGDYFPYSPVGLGYVPGGTGPPPSLGLASQQAQARRESQPKVVGPMYPVLDLPIGTRKKKVAKKVVREDGREDEVLTDGSEDELVYEKKKRLFYFDR